METRSAQLIAELVAPSVMISCAGLLLLGVQSKYSSIVTRARSLIGERKALRRAGGSAEGLANLNEQIGFLLRRAWCARNAVFCLYTSILFMTATSLCYGIRILGGFSSEIPAVLVFVMGILVFFAACVFALIEVRYAYRVIALEVEREDKD